AFVEQLWARRKVGYLLDQIRTNGEKKELVDEVTALAKKHGIATPYTSYLIVPDVATPVVTGQPASLAITPMYPVDTPPPPPPGPPRRAIHALTGAPAAAAPLSASSSAVPTMCAPAYGSAAPTAQPFAPLAQTNAFACNGTGAGPEILQKKQLYDQARAALRSGNREGYQAGQVGVELSVDTDKLRNQDHISESAARHVAGRNFLLVGGIWTDDDFEAKMPVVAIKAMSQAYFRILERHPELKEVFQLGNRVIWVTPSRTALVIDPG